MRKQAVIELICVRHGRTAWNAQKRFQGQTDIPLDVVGRAQARAVAAHLAGERFDRAMCSDLIRAAETADTIGAAAGITVARDARLREMHFGVWEGRTWTEIVAENPALDTAHEKTASRYTPDGGETFDDVCARVRPVLREIAASLGPDGRALIVSHAGVMHAIVRVALDEPDEAALGITFVPASIMRLVGDGTIPWRLAVVNETAPELAESEPAAP